MTRASAIRCVVLGSLLGLGIASTVISLDGCATTPTPVPTPTPDAGPADIFTAGIFDCRLLIVAVERDSAYPDVGACLRGAGVTDCLVHQAGQYNPATVACVARDQGASANATSLADPADAISKAIADAVRVFISSERLGYK